MPCQTHPTILAKKLKQAKTAASKQPLGVIMGEALVGGFVLAALAGAAALAAGASAPVATGIAVSTTIETMYIGEAITNEKLKRERGEKFRKFQAIPTYVEIDKSIQELRKDKKACQKLQKAVEENEAIRKIMAEFGK